MSRTLGDDDASGTDSVMGSGNMNTATLSKHMRELSERQRAEQIRQDAATNELRGMLQQLLAGQAAQRPQGDRVPPPPFEPDDDEQAVDSRHRSMKLPDPPCLTDGVNPDFRDWEIQMSGKLRTNRDHYRDEDAKMVYVFSRTQGAAARHLRPRQRANTTNRYMTA